MDELTSKPNNVSLERVLQLKSRLQFKSRLQIKSRLVSLTGRVQKVRDELEHLLNDDMDMAKMCLTEKFSSSQVDEGSYIDDKSYSGLKANTDELVMLLEAYLVQIDGIQNKLSSLREYVDDAKDCVNIMLDHKQNQLMQMGVLLKTCTIIITAGAVVTDLLGMNIGIQLFNHPPTPYSKFWKIIFGLVAAIVIIHALAIGWGKKRGLLR